MKKSMFLVLVVIVASPIYAASYPNYFTEDFSAMVLPANMERTPAAFNVLGNGIMEPNDANEVEFTYGDAWWSDSISYRKYLRTKDANYCSINFRYEATVNVYIDPLNPAWTEFWFGMGDGTANMSFWGEPNRPAIALQGKGSWLDGGEAIQYDNQETGPGGGVAGACGDGIHRVRLDWDHVRKTGTFSIMKNWTPGATFVATATIVIDGSDNGFNNTNSHLFVGGGDGLIVDDISVSYYTPAGYVCGDYGYQPMDYNVDCYVNFGDLRIICNNWLACTDPAGAGCAIVSGIVPK
jgi:hypothetical protein